MAYASLRQSLLLTDVSYWNIFYHMKLTTNLSLPSVDFISFVPARTTEITRKSDFIRNAKQKLRNIDVLIELLIQG